MKDVSECARKCDNDGGCFGFHCCQPVFRGGGVEGMGSCDLITQTVGEGDWTPLFKSNQYLTGLKVTGNVECSEKGWTRERGGADD